MNGSIKYLISKIKLTNNFLNKKEIFIVFVILFSSSASFGLGRLSKIEEVKKPVDIKNTAMITDNSTSEVVEGKYVASVSGSKYHLPWCSGAQRISAKNKIWFSSKEEAELKGYKPAKNCKGI